MLKNPVPSIEIQYGGTVRFSVVCDLGDETTTMGELIERVTKTHQLPAWTRLNFYYYDGEDLCAVTSDDELAEAFRLGRESSLRLKLVVTRDNDKPVPPPQYACYDWLVQQQYR
jgi:hypothetical protein